jgi:hypothetical protein
MRKLVRVLPFIALSLLLLDSACSSSDADEGAAGAAGAAGSSGSDAGADAGAAGTAGTAGAAGGDASDDSPPASEWWRPAPGEASDWDWQITEPYDVSAPRKMYDLDLFDLAPAGSYLAYPDGSTIDVAAGPLAGTIETLHARVPRPVVICYLDTGAYEAYRPDAARFPGHHPNSQDIPNGSPPEAGSVIGWDTGWDGERWLDIRAESRALFAHIIWARLDLARRMGCDGVEPDQNNPLDNNPGFPITLEDQLSWYEAVAAEAHARGLSVGMKNGHDQPGASQRLVTAFDWALPEECFEYSECQALEPFISAGKAVFAVDYKGSVVEDDACAEHAQQQFDGLIKDEPPSGAYRRSCAP